jgi:hypothetical protein
LPNAADIHVNEVRMRIVAHTAASQGKRAAVRFERVDARYPQINGFLLNVKTVFSELAIFSRKLIFHEY